VIIFGRRREKGTGEWRKIKQSLLTIVRVFIETCSMNGRNKEHIKIFGLNLTYLLTYLLTYSMVQEII
jgi:hypothetical protein